MMWLSYSRKVKQFRTKVNDKNLSQVSKLPVLKKIIQQKNIFKVAKYTNSKDNSHCQLFTLFNIYLP